MPTYDLGAPIAGLLDDDEDEEMPIAGPSTITSSSSGLNTPLDDSMASFTAHSKASDILGESLFDALEEDEEPYIPTYLSQPKASPLDLLSKRLSVSPEPDLYPCE